MSISRNTQKKRDLCEEVINYNKPTLSYKIQQVQVLIPLYTVAMFIQYTYI